MEASRNPSPSRHPRRDHCLLLLMYRHGLRVSEACALRLSDVDLAQKELHVRRLKKGKSSIHPLYAGEPRALNDWLAVHPHMLRHSTGYDLANRGADTRLIQAYLGHRNIQHTVRYTELAPHRFKNLF